VKFEAIAEIVKGVPFIDPGNARYLYDLIIRERLTHILELGIGHGTATCYMAAALDELEGGRITSVDLLDAVSWFKPSAEHQLEKANLAHLVQILRMQTGYSWFLHDEIRRLTTDDVCRPEYDLCVIDGPKNWTIDGGAFFLVDKVLKQDGRIIFDDYLWTYAESSAAQTDGITHRELSESERNTPQIREVFELLVKQHPNYSEFVVHPDGNWAIARKITSDTRTYSIRYETPLAGVLVGVMARIGHSLRRVLHTR
jgi:predicted O-methyltransferase YrrM